MKNYILIGLSIILLGALLTGAYVNKNGMGNKIQRMTVACQQSYKVNGATERINKDGTVTDHNKALADTCGKDIQAVEKGGHWEVVGNGQGAIWAEYKG